MNTTTATMTTPAKLIATAFGIVIAALLTLCLAPAPDAHAAPANANARVGTTFTVDGNTYKVTDRWKSARDLGEVVLVKYGSAKTNPTINTVKYQGKVYEVEAIGKGAFNTAKGRAITSVALGRNVEEIHAQAFYGCARLSTIDISKSEVIEVEYSRRTKSYYLDDVEIGALAFGKAGVKNVKVKCGSTNAKYQQVVKKALMGKGLRNTAIVVR